MVVRVGTPETLPRGSAGGVSEAAADGTAEGSAGASRTPFSREYLDYWDLLLDDRAGARLSSDAGGFRQLTEKVSANVK